MGCTSSNAEVPVPRIIQIEFTAINQYIDQIPLFIIQKLKSKFDYYCDHQFQLSEQQFLLMYTSSQKNQNSHGLAGVEQNFIWQKLYQYYTDFDRSKLVFRIFITKYAILSKCDTPKLATLLYFLYSTYKGAEDQTSPIVLTKENYDKFVTRERKNFGFQPTHFTSSTITQQQFHKSLVESGFHWEDSRRKFLLIDKDDIPFEAISRALIDMDVSDFVVGEEYYILSTTWFERWSYYYQGASSDHTEQNFKSTKLIKQRASINSGKKRKSINRSNPSRGDNSILDNTWVIERPSMITYEDIEGEFKGELKQNIKANSELRIISKQLWEMFKKTMPPERQFKRIANSPSTLDLYPKNIYYLKTDKDGKIMDSSFKIIQMSLKQQIKQVSQYSLDSKDSKDLKDKDKDKKKYYFTKNFGDNLWGEEKEDSQLGRCSIYSRFFVVQTTNKAQFVQNYFRNKKAIKNISYGDKVYKFFTFTKKVMPAYIIRLPKEKTALIHYLDYNFRYENEVAIQELSIEEDQALAESNKKETVKKLNEDTFSFKGITNIGNTCYINSVIQCLVASPILEEYFCNKKFKQDKQPLLYQIAEMASSLLSNKKLSPFKLKQAIDMELINFRGNNQHDAQEFFLQLINKLNEQIKALQKQQYTVFEYLFKGKVETSFECYECQNVSKKQQDLLSVSVPIPEPEYNTYYIFVFPIYEDRIKKVVLRLHRSCKVNDYIVGFEERLGRYAKDYIFTEIYNRDIKIRKDLLEKGSKQLLIANAVSPSSQIHCFQRFQSAQFQEIYDQNKKDFKNNSFQYFDYLDSQSGIWLYGRYMDKQMIEIMNHENSFSIVKKKNITESIKPLGEKTKQLTYKKLTNRKYNEVLQKMEFFGYHGVRYMVAFPKQITYAQLEKLINLSTQNYLKYDMRNSKKKPYFIRILETNKQTCLYCQKSQQKISSKQQVRRCCKLTEQQMNTPIMWTAREKQYAIMVDWQSLDQINDNFGQMEVDSLSLNADKVKASDKVEVEQCLKLHQLPENLEMQCQKCKHKHHRKAQTMKYVPNILVLHMKQYRITQDMTLVKMDVNLKWVQFLDITKYSVNQKGTVYELYAYIRHHGTNQSGHYTCAIKRKHPFENKKVWVNFDDELTEILDNQQKNISSAYLLFFKRVDMPNSGYVHFAHF